MAEQISRIVRKKRIEEDTSLKPDRQIVADNRLEVKIPRGLEDLSGAQTGRGGCDIGQQWPRFDQDYPNKEIGIIQRSSLYDPLANR